MNSDSSIPAAVVPPAASVAPAPQPVVAAVTVKTPASAAPATPPVAALAEKPRKKGKKQASSAARA